MSMSSSPRNSSPSANGWRVPATSLGGESTGRAPELSLPVLSAALETLPSRCREVLALRKIYGLTQREIAGRLRLSERKVEELIERAAGRSAAFLREDGAAGSAAHRAAGRWLARRDRGLGADETAEFLAWLAADAQHEAAFTELQRTFAQFDSLEALTKGERLGDPARHSALHWALRRPSAWFAAAGLVAAVVFALLQR